MLNTHGNKVTWLGHATFTVTTLKGDVILIDPWTAGNPACPEPFRKPKRVDLLLITHCHADHVGDLLPIAREHKPHIVAIYETAMWLGSKQIEKVHPMGKGGTQEVLGIEVTMVDARHSNSIVDDGKTISAGEPAGFVVRFPGGFSIYHAGDTCVFGDMKLIGELYSPDLAMLPIGDLFTMGPREAAHAVGLLGVQHVVPMHYGTFPGLTGTVQAFREAVKNIPDLEVHTMKPGETLG
jgi:L-ascorbate metabolism protein UlaG (beta-lactamase superfamily)